MDLCPAIWKPADGVYCFPDLRKDFNAGGILVNLIDCRVCRSGEHLVQFIAPVKAILCLGNFADFKVDQYI